MDQGKGDPREGRCALSRVPSARRCEGPVDGRARIGLPAPPEVLTRRVVYPPGSARISTDQPLGDLAALLLEPQSEDSFFQWGYFLEILTRTEYVEGYVMEPMARKMLEEDPELKKAFEKAIEDDPIIALDPRERLQWFYRHTPFFDPQWRLYPVGREMAP